MDDMIITGNDIEEIENLKQKFLAELNIKSLGHLGCYQGTEVTCSKEVIFLHQHNYVIGQFPI